MPTDKRILRLPGVIASTGLSKSTIARLEARGRFPRRRQVSSKAVGWLSTEIDAWIRDLPEAPLVTKAR